VRCLQAAQQEAVEARQETQKVQAMRDTLQVRRALSPERTHPIHPARGA
jgi:hypothetical protein